MTEARKVTKFLRRIFLAYLILLIVFTCFGKYISTEGPIPTLGDSSTVFFFHSRSEIYRNENGSIFVYDGADGGPPLATEAVMTVLRCEVKQQIPYSSFTTMAYVGMVEWVTPPLSEDYVVDGTVTMNVWLSSSDINPQISGYMMAITDLDENGNAVGDLFYNYKYDAGKVISTEPTEYSLGVTVNHVFARDHKLAFQVIVGSTIQGWTANVYFDSPDKASRAVLPDTPTVVPEFERTALTLALTLTVAATFFLLRKRRALRSV